MNWTEGLNYVLFQNPISSSVINTVSGVGKSIFFKENSTVAKLPPALEKLPVHKIVFCGSPFVRLAGISGASAVILGAYGAHNLFNSDKEEEKKKIFQTANNYHFIHSLALLASPLSRHPKTVGTLMTLGMIMFCGTCYFDAITGNPALRKLTPIGGTCLIFGWLCFLL